MNNCIFNVNDLNTSLEMLGDSLYDRLSPIPDYGLNVENSKQEILREVTQIGESFLINPLNVDEALKVFEDESLFYGLEESIPSKEELREAMILWQNKESKESEDTSTSRLNNKNKDIERIADDPIALFYGRALKAKIRANLHANTIGVHSILYNENGIINTTEDLNRSIVLEQEKLLSTIINYIRSKGFEVSGKMYSEGNYTGIVEELNSKYAHLFKFDFNELNYFYNNNDLETLDAISSWVILNNFDTILKNTFGKAINVDPDKSKYDTNKYSVSGGSNVYTTWRTNDEIDLSKEINNISQAIIISLPYYLADSNSPIKEKNLKFNEFIYLISKLKDLPHSLKEDFVFNFEGIDIDQKTKQYLEGKSISYIINTLRDNPQKILPLLLNALNNKIIFNDIKSNLPQNYFVPIDRDLINTVYLGIFNLENENSLYSILKKSGFKRTNYFSFITQTIDSTFKSNFLQYFRDDEGNIYVRLMYDQSIYAVEQNIKSQINNQTSFLSLKDFNFEDNNTNEFNFPAGTHTFTIEGLEYKIEILQPSEQKIINYLDQFGNKVTNQNIINELNKGLKNRFTNPTEVSFIYNDYHKGPLKITVNLLNGNVEYSTDRGNELFEKREDLDSLLPLIEMVIRLNLNIDRDYLNAYLNIIKSEYISASGTAAKELMRLVSKVLVNKYIQENYIKYTKFGNIKSKINDIFGDSLSKPTYNLNLKELNYLPNSEISTIRNLAQAKALVTGKLTSSLILDGEGNALASSALSRLVNSLDYQIEEIKRVEGSAKNFSLWKPGVYKGVYQLKEFKDIHLNKTKSHTMFSNKEMETSLVFIDFVSGIMSNFSTKSPYTDGVVGFYPSENSDKTYVGRLLVDLKKILVGEKNLYELIKDNPLNITEFLPTIRLELYEFYLNVLNNINEEWNKIGLRLGINISYGKWDELYTATEDYNYRNYTKLTPIEYLKQEITLYNYNNPFNPITLIENVHFIEGKNGTLMRNSSLDANLLRFKDDNTFKSFMRQQNIDVLKNLLLDGVSVDANSDIVNLVGKSWVDSKTNKVILGKYYDPLTKSYVGDIRRYRDFDVTTPYTIVINPILSAYNSLNYFFTLEYMNSSVGAYYGHPNKKSSNVMERLERGEITLEQANREFLEDEKLRKLALDKRNVSFTAAMHSMLKNLIQGIPETINIAIMPDVHDAFETVSGDIEEEIKPYDGATFTNPFYQILQNYSLGGAKVGKIKKTFTHFYNEKTGTGGIIKTAEFPLTNEWIRRSKFYKIMMLNMTDRVWRDKSGNPCTVDITTDYEGNPIIFNNPESDLGYMYFQDDVTGEYYMFNITKGDLPNTYIRTIQKVDENGLPTLDKSNPETWTVNTNYDLWRMFGGEHSVSFNKGKFNQSEHSIYQVVEIMNNTTIAGLIANDVETQEDLWQPLKHSDIHLMPTSGAVKLGAANTNSENNYTEADSTKINHFRIKMNLVGVLLDKEHHADGEDLSIMTLVLSACAARGYTPEMMNDLYNALASLAESGIRPYLKNFEEFFKVSIDKDSTPQQLEEARQRFENVLLDTLIKALANSTNTSATLSIITLELIEKAKEGKDINFASLKIPLSDPSVMRKLHSTISVALTQAAIKIKVDGSLNILCPSFGIVKVYNGKMYESFLNDNEIVNELKLYNENPNNNLVNKIHEIKLGRTYLCKLKNGSEELKHIKLAQDYYELRSNLHNYESIYELFAPYEEIISPEHSMLSPEEIQIQLTGNLDLQIEKARELGLEIDTFIEPKTLEEVIADNLPKLKSDSFVEETGIKNFLIEGKLGFFDNKNGISIKKASEILAQVAEDNGFPSTDSEIRDIINDLVKNYTPGQVKNLTKQNRLDEALAEYEREYNEESNYIRQNTEIKRFEGGRELGSYNAIFSGNILPTTLSNIIVTGNPRTTKLKALELGGIDTLRHPDKNGMHFGNPFTPLEKEVLNGKAAIFVPSVREAVIAFELWLDGTAYLDIEPERRQWILNQINSGELYGKPLIYYTHTIKDNEGSHYYNPETFPNHAHILLKKINLRGLELAGPLFQQSQIIYDSFNLYDLISVKNLHDLKAKGKGNYTKQELDDALTDLQKDLNVLHSRKGQVLTHKGLVEIDSNSVQIEPYEIIMPKIFASIFGLNEDDDLDTIKKDKDFFTKRLLNNLLPKLSEYTLCLQKVNGKHTYILNSNDAVLTDYFKPKSFQLSRENGKLYRVRNGEILYEIGENDQIWEKINPDGSIIEVIVTDSLLSYLDRVDYVTININKNNSEEYNQELINQLRNSDNKYIQKYLKSYDYAMTWLDETTNMAIEDIQEVGLTNYEDNPMGNYYKTLGNELYSSFLKSLEVVAARIPAQSMLSFMPMKIVGFEKSDINTAYVSVALVLFLGSDYDIDAVSLASFAFDESGRYVLHSPYANIQSFELLKASEKLPFPTGKELEINDDELFDYSQLISNNGPFLFRKGRIYIQNYTPEQILTLGQFILYVNKKGYIPASSDPSLSIAVNGIRGHINKHNNFINTSKDVEKFAKNYIVTAMYNIGISPANLIESQQAMDSITKPLKDIANLTLKALLHQSIDNPANYTTNIRGFVLNMDGKQGVGICAVGLKSFFAATARYNEVLNNGSKEEVERLKSSVTIANKKFLILANAYTTNEVNQAILGEIITLLEQGTDAALILSALLSLSTDNAKELALSKLNAANMLGMYIYGIAIGMDFRDIANIIASKSGQILDSLIKEDVISNINGRSWENIFDYIELGPRLEPSKKVPIKVDEDYSFISQSILRELAWQRAYIEDGTVKKLKDSGYNTILDLKYANPNVIVGYNELFDFLELKKRDIPNIESDYREGLIEFNNNIEKAQEYLYLINEIISDQVILEGRPLLYYNGDITKGVYADIKKLYKGAEEFRRLGLVLHINQGNETSYSDAINYIETIESVMESAQYRNYRERCRKEVLKGGKKSDVTNWASEYRINFHKFINNLTYREGCIDLNEGICREDIFKRSDSYREIFLQAFKASLDAIQQESSNEEEFIEKAYKRISEIIYPTKTFFNIFDIIQVPHYMKYLQSADMLHLYMQNSIKYRSIYNLGTTAIKEIGAYSSSDKQSIYRRTEQLIDRILRDRFFISLELNFEIPVGLDIFEREENNIKRITVKNSSAIIKLGTREGNASFKLWMEEVIIPELKKMSTFKDNKFILSLSLTLFLDNPELQITRCYAPSINMSPRSDVDRALFEEIKYDFNQLRTIDFSYVSGGIKHNLIDLFYYYNLITFNGRVGENTLTNIFLDVLDFGNIKNYRDYESFLDKYGEILLIKQGVKGSITLNTLIKETAPRASEFNTTFNYFYNINQRTGELSFYERNTGGSVYNPVTELYEKLEKYKSSLVEFTNKDDSKDYLVLSSDSDIVKAHFILKPGLKVNVLIEKGSITDINVDGESIEIPYEDKEFFRNLKTISKLLNGILEKYYNKNLIISKIEEIVNCK